VLRHHDRRGEPCGKRREERRQRPRPAGGSADRHDLVVAERGRLHRCGRFRGGGGVDAAARRKVGRGAHQRPHPLLQERREVVDVHRRSRTCLVDEVDGACFQRLEGDLGAGPGVRAEEQHRRGSLAHDAPQGVQTVHSGHVDVHDHQVRPQREDLLQRLGAVGGGVDDAHLVQRLQHPRGGAAHEGAVVHQQHVRGDPHAGTPGAV
jgi:hypothetical protein